MSNERRLLLIDYNFGSAGVTGGFRWRAMAAHLVEQGWRFDVITTGEPVTTVPRDDDPIRVFRVPIPTTVDDAVAWIARLKRRLRPRPAAQIPAAVELAAAVPVAAPATSPVAPGGLYSRAANVVNAIRITSAEWGWGRRAERFARPMMQRHQYAAVIVCSPPHMTQLAGAALSRRFGVPYVADFRDPWVFGRPEKHDVNLFAIPLGRMYEARTLRQASLIFCNTDHGRRAVAEIYPDLAQRTLAVPNGYDVDGSTPPVPDAGRFRIVFAGWFYPFMDPEAVLAAAGRLRQREGLGPDQLAVEFMGCDVAHGGIPLVAMAARQGVADCFYRYPPSPRAEARKLQGAASVLVAFDASTQLAMPSKFYDYAQMGGRMLLFGFPDGALAAAGAQLGLRVYQAADAPGIDAALDDAYRRWRSGQLTAPVDKDGLFDRRRQSARVHEALTRIVR